MRSHLGKTHGWAAVVFDDVKLAVTTARPAGGEFSVVLETTEPLGAPVEGLEPAARYQAAVQTLRQRVDLREHQIVTAISGDHVLCQTLRLPTTDAGELKQMLDLQIDNLAPLPVEEVVYSFEPLETTGTETRILLAVARKAVVNERVAALEAAGWRPEIVSVDVLAVFQELLRQGALPSDDRLNVLVFISSAAVNFIVFTAGNIVTVRSVMLGDPAFVREELTRTRIAAEVEHPGLATGQILYAPANESLRGMVVELAAGAAVIANGSSPNPVRSVCLESARTGSVRLNLLPNEWRERRRKARFRQVALRSGIGLGTVYLVVLATFLTMLGIKQAQIHGVEAQLHKLQPTHDDALELRKTFMTMQQRLDTQHSALEVLREVSQLIPEKVKLSGFTFKKDEKVTLRGKAQAAGYANDYIGRLEKSELFMKVTPGAQRIEPGTGLTTFDVECSLKTSGTPHGAK